MTGPIVESGSSWPYPNGHCFYIEKSETYKAVQDGVPTAEFLLLRIREGQPPVVWVVEAKSSAPRPAPHPRFDEFVREIRDKLVNAFSLGLAACLERHSAQAELPAPFRALNLRAAGFRLVLVIKGFQEEWLPPLQDALGKELAPVRKTWALGAKAIAVLNNDGARKHGLIDVPTAAPNDGGAVLLRTPSWIVPARQVAVPSGIGQQAFWGGPGPNEGGDRAGCGGPGMSRLEEERPVQGNPGTLREQARTCLRRSLDLNKADDHHHRRVMPREARRAGPLRAARRMLTWRTYHATRHRG